jgi:23S rRNA (guanosine2251-2'-O)-methyltransferase
MKPPHSNRHGGSNRPPSDRGPYRGGGGPSQPSAGPQRGPQGGQGPRPERPQGQRGPQGKPFTGRQGKEANRNLRQHDNRPRHPPDVPRGAVWLYGLHAVTAALANPSRRLRRLLLTEEAQQTLAQRLAQPWPLAPEQVERGRIDHLLGRDIAHQGAALLADPLAPPSLQHALERPGPLIVLDQVTDPRNVGAILRSAAAFGAAAVITQDRNAPEETGALAKAASGALETVPLLRAVNIARTLIALKAAGCWVVGLDAGGGALAGPAFAERRVALVLGAEGEGLRRLTRETCDELAGLAMKGPMESLNVSAAAAVALYELTRR